MARKYKKRKCTDPVRSLIRFYEKLGDVVVQIAFRLLIIIGIVQIGHMIVDSIKMIFT